MRLLLRVTLVALTLIGCSTAQAVDERPAGPGEWGFKPDNGARATVNPPAFVWRPQKNAVRYQWQASRDDEFKGDVVAAETRYPVHCPSRIMATGTWYWRFRYSGKTGAPSAWSTVRTVDVPTTATALPLPDRDEIAARVPKSHPRLFLRPEDVPGLRNSAEGKLAEHFARLVTRCQRLLRQPPPTAEPPKYPAGTERKGEEWRKIWWGNRTYTIAVLKNATDLAFAGLIGKRPEFTQLARQLLLDAANWDPHGATGYRYNDEAGMPYAYWFSRAYTLLHGELDAGQRRLCREVMRERGREMYAHLAPRHLWQPYSSHSNRAWHFLGEVGIAFFDEIPEAPEWVFFATRVFGATYPVWSDSDGGWHEGMAYWRSYLGRFTWWADVMERALRVDAYCKPFFAKVGDFAMYLQPPGTRGGGFGDLTAAQTSKHQAAIMADFALAANNGHWQWYADAHGVQSTANDFIGYLRAARSSVEPRPPTDLPSSKLFRGTGIAALNCDLTSAADNVEVIFKSSPFGTQSHGYESQNSFLLYAFGERLLIRSGHRDIYGSAHHTKWMWSTRSTNCITVDDGGQIAHSAKGRGEVSAFATDPAFDYVAGEAGPAYPNLDRFTRRILFVKPEWIVVYDTLQADRPRQFTWWLHSVKPMDVKGDEVLVVNGKAACKVKFMLPRGLELRQSAAFDPPPRPRVKLVQHHLTATTPNRLKAPVFVTVIRPVRSESIASDRGTARIEPFEGGYRLRLEGAGEPVVVDLRDERLAARRGERRFASETATLR